MTALTDAHVADLADSLVGAVNHQLLDAIATGDPGPELTQVVLSELATHTAWLPVLVVDLLQRVTAHIEAGLPKPAASARPHVNRRVPGVRNSAANVSGSLVQARDIGGGVHIQ